MSELTFESAMKRLEEITALLESGGLTLEESTKCYEEGVKLSKFCSEKLENAKLKIIQLTDREGTQDGE